MNNVERAEYMRARRATPEGREERRRLAQQNRRQNPIAHAARKLRHYRKHKLAIRARKKGLSAERVNVMLEAQDGRCAICGRAAVLVIDHDHRCCPGQRSCGACVRGLICQSCNKMLGFAGDRAETLIAAVAFLDGR